MAAASEPDGRPDLRDRVTLVTGATRGVGRGVALGLAHAGATVFATGRTVEPSPLGEGIRVIACDHTDDQAVARVFDRIDRDSGLLDILVNVAWGGYERMVEDGRVTYPLAADPDVARRNGSVLVAAALAREDGVTDIDGVLPTPLEGGGA